VARFTYSTASPAEVDADVLVLPVFEGPEAGPGVKDVKGIDLLQAYKDAKLTGKRGETLRVPSFGAVEANGILLLGVGKRSEATPESLRRAIGKVAASLAKQRSLATTLPQVLPRNAEDAVQATAEGLLLGSYRFDRYKTSPNGKAPSELKTVTILGGARSDSRAAKRALDRAQVISESVAWARDLVNTPALEATPDYLAKQAQRMAKEVGLKVKVWNKTELERGGMGGILGVGRGSVNDPRLIELQYNGGGRAQPIAITGKGITFDSGGLSIKDAKNMETMKCDMAGAAAMLATMRTLALLKPRVNVIAAIPSSENMPGGSSIRPGDVLKHRGGKTSEVLNTDAEGRLVLADALAYLAEKKPRVIIDAATLTGACMVALGDQITGVMGNDRALIRDIIAAGERAGEPMWELPLFREYHAQIDSNLADVKNIGERWGGAITAALFLEEFVDDIPWAHLDIAGPAFTERSGDYTPKGGTGVPVRTMVEYILSQAGGSSAKRR
jgi:leucyl aminopeptidase